MSSVLVVGAGVWGATVASRLIRLGVGAVLLDSDRERARSVAHSIGADVARSDDECFSEVIVCTPPGEGRLPLIRSLIERGARRIRVEKPLGLTLNQAQQFASCSAMITPAVTPLYDSCFSVMRGIISAMQGCAHLESVRTSERVPNHTIGVGADLMIHDAAIHSMLMSAKSVRPVERAEGMRLVVSVDKDGRRVGSMRAERSSRRVRMHRVTCPDGLRASWDENLGVVSVNGRIIHRRNHGDDPLGRELSAWLNYEAYPLSLGVDAVRILGDDLLADSETFWKETA